MPEYFFARAPTNHSEKPQLSRISRNSTVAPPSQLTLGSIEPVKIAFRWRILNDMDVCQK
jgi:hypothetical protein